MVEWPAKTRVQQGFVNKDVLGEGSIAGSTKPYKGEKSSWQNIATRTDVVATE